MYLAVPGIKISWREWLAFFSGAQGQTQSVRSSVRARRKVVVFLALELTGSAR